MNITKATQAVHASVHASPSTPTPAEIERILSTALGASRQLGASTLTLEGIAVELEAMARIIADCDRIERAWRKDAQAPTEGPLAEAYETANDLTVAMLARGGTLASAACLCEAHTLGEVYILTALADHLFEQSTMYDRPPDEAQLRMAQRLQDGALRGLARLGAVDNRSPKFMASFLRGDADLRRFKPIAEAAAAVRAFVEGELSS